MRIKWLGLVLLDLDDVESYVAQDNPVAASEVILKIIKAVSMIEQQPGLGRPGRVSGTKELAIPNTSYIVPYRVKEGMVQVLRVYHSARKCPNRL